MLDEALLDDAEALAGADARGTLRALAAVGARVRTAARLADEAGLSALKPDGRPRTVLVAGDGAAGYAGEVLAALSGGYCPILPVTPSSGPRGGPQWALPGWAGPIDLLLVASPAGTDPGLMSLVEQVYQRGCTVVSVAPPDSPLAESTRQARGLGLPYVPPPRLPAAGGREPGPGTGPSSGLAPGPVTAPDPDTAPGPGAAPDPGILPDPHPASRGLSGGRGGEPAEDMGELWALLVPLLALADRIGIANAPASALQAVADRLDETAATCGPATATYQNPAKTLAAELAGTLPLLWSEGAGAGAVARRFAACLAERAGRPALPAALPGALTGHRGLLAGTFSNGDDPDEFFRDRLEEPQALRLRVVLLREHGPESAVSDATPAHRLAREHGTAVSEVRASAAGALEDTAQLLALTDFASVYLALAERP